MPTKAQETILIIAANPGDSEPLSLDREVREIQNGLRNSRKRFEIRQQWATRPKDLRRALLDYRPAYVHFCGHGAGNAGIVLEGQLADAESLAGLFSLFASTVKCIVLNACYSTIQAKAIVRHIDFVVGMDHAIGDSAAIEFSTAFYDALGAGESVEFAFALGCNAIQLAGIPEHLTPKLLTRTDEALEIYPSQSQSGALKHDWDSAPEASLVYGRQADAELLKSWILGDSCRVVLITGLGGVGKTDLATCLGRGGNRSADSSATLVSGIQGHFDRVIWRSLLNAPAPDVLFADLLNFLSEHQRIVRYETGRQIDEILNYFQEHRCLVILDNVEAVLKPGDPNMRYQEGYHPYGTFFAQVAKTTHQSCLLLTSREKPSPIADLEGARKPVRSLSLGGIGTIESQNLFAQIGTFSGNTNHWSRIVNLYNGNPLALELAARHIDQVFDGNLAAFLGAGRPIFADLEDLLNWHLDRLSREEKEIVIWFAIEREPITIATLYDNLLSPVSRLNIASTLQSLQRRIPLEHFGNGKFGLQPVLIEHVTSRYVDQVVMGLSKVCASFRHSTGERESRDQILNSLDSFNRYSLVKGTARENTRDSQKRLILAPITNRIADSHHGDLTKDLTALLSCWRRDKLGEPGYAIGNIIHMLSYLNIDLHGLDFSHLRIWQACLHDVNLHTTDFSFAEFRHTTFRHAFGTVFSVAYSPNGELIAIGDDNGEIRLFLASTGQLRTRCIGHSDVIGSIAFSPDGRTVASASFDNTIRLWDPGNGECTKVLLGHEGWIYSIAFSPDGNKLASASEDGTCRLWDVKTCHSVCVGNREPAFLAAVTFSPNGRSLAVAGSAGTIRLIDTSDPDRSLVFSECTGKIRSLAFSPQGDILASGGEDNRIYLWQPSNGTCIATLVGHTDDVMSLSYTANGDILASASQDQTVRLWSTAQRHCIGRIDVAAARVWTVGCSPAGRTLATGSEDGAVRIWDIDTCQCLSTLQGYSNKTWAIAFSTYNPAMLVAGNEDKLVRVWNICDARIALELRGHSNRVWAVDCSADGNWLASASDDNTVRLWDFRSGICKHILCGHIDWIRAVAFSPNSLSLASAAEDGKLILWDVILGKSIVTINTDISRIFAAVFCSGGRWLAVGGAGNAIHLFDARTGMTIYRLSGHQGWINCIIPLRDSMLATCSDDGTIRVWDLDRFECLAILQDHTKITCCASGDEDRSILTGTDDGSLRLWDVRKETCIAEVRAHQGPIRSLSVNVHNKIAASAGDDGTIRLWRLGDLSPHSTPHVLRPTRPYEGMNITGASGLTSAQKEALTALGAIAIPAS